MRSTQKSFKAPSFQPAKSKASSSNSASPATGAGSILSFFRPSAQSVPLSTLRNSNPSPSTSLQSLAKRPNPYSPAGNLPKAKKENENRGSGSLIARSKFFGRAEILREASTPDDFPDDERVDCEEVERDEARAHDEIDIDGEEYLRELEQPQFIVPPPPPKRQASVVSSLGGISSPPATSPPRKRRRISRSPSEESFPTAPTDDLGVSSPPVKPEPDDLGVLSSPPRPKNGALPPVAIKDERIVSSKGETNAREPLSDPIDVFLEPLAAEDVDATPRSRARDESRRAVGIKRERTLVQNSRLNEGTDEVDQVPTDVAVAWRTKWEHKGTGSSVSLFPYLSLRIPDLPLQMKKLLASCTLRKTLAKPSIASPATLPKPSRPTPSPLPLRSAPIASTKSIYKSAVRSPLSPKKISTVRPSLRGSWRDGGEDDEAPSAALLAFRYAGAL